jgi:hypothetical protein
MFGRATFIVAVMLVATPAFAQDREYCPARPGLGEPACTLDPGKVSVEVGIASWQRDDNPGSRIDTIMLADTLVRAGLTNDTEVSVAWTPYIRERTRDASGVSLAQGGSDLTVALKHNLHNPDGSGFSLAVEGYATLPVAGEPGGAGDWAAGLVVPASVDLGSGLSLQSTSEADAAVDADGDGRHFALSEVVGLGIPLTKDLTMTAEAQLLRDWDPSGATTEAYAGLSFALSLSDDLQVDAGSVVGLNASAPDVQIYAGISRRF